MDVAHVCNGLDDLQGLEGEGKEAERLKGSFWFPKGDLQTRASLRIQIPLKDTPTPLLEASQNGLQQTRSERDMGMGTPKMVVSI